MITAEDFTVQKVKNWQRNGHVQIIKTDLPINMN